MLLDFVAFKDAVTLPPLAIAADKSVQGNQLFEAGLSRLKHFIYTRCSPKKLLGLEVNQTNLLKVADFAGQAFFPSQQLSPSKLIEAVGTYEAEVLVTEACLEYNEAVTRAKTADPNSTIESATSTAERDALARYLEGCRVRQATPAIYNKHLASLQQSFSRKKKLLLESVMRAEGSALPHSSSLKKTDSAVDLDLKKWAKANREDIELSKAIPACVPNFIDYWKKNYEASKADLASGKKFKAGLLELLTTFCKTQG